MTAPFARRLLAEFTGTALLVAIVVGAGVAAQRLSPTDAGLQLLETSTAVGLGLTVLILMFAPVSGGHFNPVLSIANWYFGRHDRSGLRLGELPGYLSAQLLGGVVGAALANVMFDLPALQIATEHHISSGRVIGEVVATAGLIAAIFAVAQTGRAARSAAVVGGYVG